MPINSFLKDYAEKYDDFYAEKDYRAEAEALGELFLKHKVWNVLDIACGTGKHMEQLGRLGYAVRGFDASPAMVKIAQSKYLDASVCDMRDIFNIEQFDAVICMFASFDYILSKGDACKVIDNVYRALKPKGLFIFDFWNKPIVEKDYQPVRAKNGKVSFTSLSDNIATIDIYFDKHNETHLMRYYDIDEIKEMLKKFNILEMKHLDNYWSVQVICQKPQ